MDQDIQQPVNNPQASIPVVTKGKTPYAIGIAVVLIILVGVGYLLTMHGQPHSSANSSTPQNGSAANTRQQNPSTNSTAANSSTQQNQSSSGYVTCAPVLPEFNCSAVSDPVIHSYLSLYSNETTIFNGTFINMEITQNTGKNWTYVNISFVPLGTPTSGGIPEYNFTSPGNTSAAVFDMYTGQFALALFIPVSKQTSGNFTGQLWAHYYVNGSSSPQYSLIGNVTVHSFP